MDTDVIGAKFGNPLSSFIGACVLHRLLEVYEHIDDDIIRLVGTELSLATRPRTAGASAMAAALRSTLAAP